MVFFQVVFPQGLSFGDFARPLLFVTGIAAAEAVHEDGGAGAGFPAKDAFVLGPAEEAAAVMAGIAEVVGGEGDMILGFFGGHGRGFEFGYGLVVDEEMASPGVDFEAEGSAGGG
jgi:hypothetical protein